jgi:hypothetical protein
VIETGRISDGPGASGCWLLSSAKEKSRGVRV